MSPAEFKEFAEGIGSLITASAVLGAGILFLVKREWHPRLEIAPGVEAFRRVDHSFLLEPVCLLHNKGLLRCYIYRLKLSVRYLRRGDPLARGDDRLLFATTFPHSALSVDLVKPEWVWSYVEAGIRLRYSHVVHIPVDAVAVLVWVKVFHRKDDTTDFFSAQKVGVIIDDQLVMNKHLIAADTGEGEIADQQSAPTPQGSVLRLRKPRT